MVRMFGNEDLSCASASCGGMALSALTVGHIRARASQARAGYFQTGEVVQVCRPLPNVMDKHAWTND